MEGTCVSQESSERTRWGIIFICSVLYSSPLTTHVLSRSLSAMLGAEYGQRSQLVSASYTLWITGDLLDNCWLLFSSIHYVVERGHTMLDLKSKWDVLDVTFWEAVETIYFALLLTYTLNDVDKYWSYSLSELFIFVLELNIESRHLQHRQHPHLEITLRALFKTDDVCKRA